MAEDTQIDFGDQLGNVLDTLMREFGKKRITITPKKTFPLWLMPPEGGGDLPLEFRFFTQHRATFEILEGHKAEDTCCTFTCIRLAGGKFFRVANAKDCMLFLPDVSQSQKKGRAYFLYDNELNCYFGVEFDFETKVD